MLKLRITAPGFCCVMLAASQTLAHGQSAPAPFTAQMKKAVVFIQTDCKATPRNSSHSGTGFYVWMPEPRVGPDSGFMYLVTNRHVVEPGIEDSKPCNVVGRSVRVNLKANDSGSPSSELVPLENGGGEWFFPSDDSVDLAVMPVNPDQNKFDFQTIPVSMFADAKSAGIVEGDAVLFAGLFIQYMGRTRIQPIVRSGSIAMIPGELIPTTLKKLGRVYFTEVHAFGGNSGSPMFVDLAGLRRGKLGYEFKLLGVVAGEVFETADFELQVNATFKGDVTANSGISVVVPVDELKTLLDSPPLQKKRDAAVAKAKPKAP